MFLKHVRCFIGKSSLFASHKDHSNSELLSFLQPGYTSCQVVLVACTPAQKVSFRVDSSIFICGFYSSANDLLSGLKDQAVTGPVVRIDIADFEDIEAGDESMFFLIITSSIWDIEMLIDDLGSKDILVGGDEEV